MAEDPDPRTPPWYIQRKALVMALIVVAVATVSYFMLHSIEMETASDRTHGFENSDYTAREAVPPPDLSQD